MKKLLFLGALLLTLASRAYAQVAPTADIVVVRLYESNNVTAIITRGEGKSEKVQFDNGLTDKGLTRASEGYYKLFEQLYREGYTLQSTISKGSGALITLLFVKK